MQIGGKERVTHPAKEVFLAARDKMVDMLPYLPNVEGIEVVERTEESGMVTLLNHWKGSPDDVPKAMRAFVKPDMLRWKDYADWMEDDLCCLWRLETFVATGFFECSGRTEMIPDGDDACFFTLEGNLSVYPEKIVGRLLAKGVPSGMIEKFIANLLEPNLTSMAKAIQSYLDEKKKEG